MHPSDPSQRAGPGRSIGAAAILAACLLLAPDACAAKALEPDALDWSAHRATVLIFVQPDCPISNQYAPAINRLHRDFSKQDVAFVLVYPDARLAPETIAAHLRDYAYTCDYAADPNQSLVQLTQASVTPEAAVLDRAGGRVYLGRIDNRYVDFGKKRPKATHEDLRVALELVIAGRPVEPSQTKAVGCYIDKSKG